MTVCRAENKKRAANPYPAPKFTNPAKATPAQLKAGAPYLARDLAITYDEVHKVFALGTPEETAARTAWLRLKTVLVKYSLPAFAKAVADLKKGDGKLVAADFAKSSRYDAEQTKLQKTIGLKVCGNG
ncbi:MAG: hypothetical protein H0X39_17920 [Actinobacteria bacterium]|nr:hypothetical protein [Actinomycetota bacterium]